MDEAKYNLEFKEAHVVLAGDNNTVTQTVNNILQRRYRGDNAKLRRAIQHDLEMLERYPEGKVRDELVASIEENTNKLIARGRMTLGQVWARRAAAIVIAAVLLLVTSVFCIGTAARHALIDHGYPDQDAFSKWVYAITATAGTKSLSPRGNVMPGREPVDVKGKLEGSKDEITLFSFSLFGMADVSECDQNLPDRTPHPKNGKFVLLMFEVTGGDTDIQGGHAFEREHFSAISLDGQSVSGIGDGPGTECLPKASTGGLTQLSAHENRKIGILADVPDANGLIRMSFTPRYWEQTWEWAY